MTCACKDGCIRLIVCRDLPEPGVLQNQFENAYWSSWDRHRRILIAFDWNPWYATWRVRPQYGPNRNRKSEEKAQVSFTIAIK